MSSFISAPEIRARRGAFAVELVDPVTLRPVVHGLKVSAVGVRSNPVRTLSDRFAWLGSDWPEAIEVTPEGAPFLPERFLAPAMPASPAAADRALRFMLRPTVAYPFGSGVTAVRGNLVERDDGSQVPVAGARIQLAWFDLASSSWLPGPPGPVSDEATPTEAVTDRRGDFAAFLRLRPDPTRDPDLVERRLRVRLQVMRANPALVTRASLDERVVEGSLVPQGFMLAWNALITI